MRSRHSEVVRHFVWSNEFCSDKKSSLALGGSVHSVVWAEEHARRILDPVQLEPGSKVRAFLKMVLALTSEETLPCSERMCKERTRTAPLHSECEHTRPAPLQCECARSALNLHHSRVSVQGVYSRVGAQGAHSTFTTPEWVRKEHTWPAQA